MIVPSLSLHFLNRCWADTTPRVDDRSSIHYLLLQKEWDDVLGDTWTAWSLQCSHQLWWCSVAMLLADGFGIPVGVGRFWRPASLFVPRGCYTTMAANHKFKVVILNGVFSVVAGGRQKEYIWPALLQYQRPVRSLHLGWYCQVCKTYHKNSKSLLVTPTFTRADRIGWPANVLSSIASTWRMRSDSDGSDCRPPKGTSGSNARRVEHSLLNRLKYLASALEIVVGLCHIAELFFHGANRVAQEIHHSELGRLLQRKLTRYGVKQGTNRSSVRLALAYFRA